MPRPWPRDVQVKGDLIEALRAPLSAEALVQLTLTIEAANFTNRFNEALGTELEDRTSA
jgi:alkylhydroperoxidase family enzyme